MAEARALKFITKGVYINLDLANSIHSIGELLSTMAPRWTTAYRTYGARGHPRFDLHYICCNVG